MKRENDIICLDSVYLAYCYVKDTDGYSFIGEKLVKRVPDSRGIALAYQEVGNSDCIYYTIDMVKVGEMGLDDIRPFEEYMKRDCVSKNVDIDYLFKLYYKYINNKKVRKRVI